MSKIGTPSGDDYPEAAGKNLLDAQALLAAPWHAVGENAGPPIVVFYSFKGGVGRTTSLASFAIQRARLGERVAVIDLDLDAPGVGTLLAADEKGTAAQWGVVDYLLERPVSEVDIRDYYHACRRQGVTGEGEILVIPAAR
jgi:MinD-like ATPase involved in chromosome partitioning or flagellar assembly